MRTQEALAQLLREDYRLDLCHKRGGLEGSARCLSPSPTQYFWRSDSTLGAVFLRRPSATRALMALAAVRFASSKRKA